MPKWKALTEISLQEMRLPKNGFGINKLFSLTLKEEKDQCPKNSRNAVKDLTRIKNKASDTRKKILHLSLFNIFHS